MLCAFGLLLLLDEVPAVAPVEEAPPAVDAAPVAAEAVVDAFVFEELLLGREGGGAVSAILRWSRCSMSSREALLGICAQLNVVGVGLGWID